jgi:hypothetical protein
VAQGKATAVAKQCSRGAARAVNALRLTETQDGHFIESFHGVKARSAPLRFWRSAPSFLRTGACRLASGRSSIGTSPATSGGTGLPRQGSMRGCAVTFFSQRVQTSSGPGPRRFLSTLPFAVSRGSALASFCGSLSFARWPKFHARTARFGKTNRDRLFRRARPVFALANVVHLLADKLTSLSGSGFPLTLVSSGT